MGSNNFLSENQFGYHKQRSIELATILLTDNIRKAVDKGNLIGVLNGDFSKAFDTLSHSILLEILKSLGINESAHVWFSDYLINRKQYFVIEKCTSESMNIVCGVPQGSILGPLLFLIYLNDFEKFLPYSQAFNFAYGTVVYITGKCKDIIEYQLHEDLKLILTYFQTNQLVSNLKRVKPILGCSVQQKG